MIKNFHVLYDLVGVTCIELLHDSLQFDFIFHGPLDETILVCFSKKIKSFPGIMRKLFNKPVIKFIPYEVQFDVNKLFEEAHSAKTFLNYIKEEINKALGGPNNA